MEPLLRVWAFVVVVWWGCGWFRESVSQNLDHESKQLWNLMSSVGLGMVLESERKSLNVDPKAKYGGGVG